MNLIQVVRVLKQSCGNAKVTSKTRDKELAKLATSDLILIFLIFLGPYWSFIGAGADLKHVPVLFEVPNVKRGFKIIFIELKIKTNDHKSKL